MGDKGPSRLLGEEGGGSEGEKGKRKNKKDIRVEKVGLASFKPWFRPFSMQEHAREI